MESEYGIADFNLEDFELIAIMDIIDEEKVEKTWDIEVEGKHHFFVTNPLNAASECIVSHNTAEIAIGEPNDVEYRNLKNYEINPERAEYGWTSNNSIYAELGMDYTDVAERTWHNGEPGYVWLDNIRGYSRIKNGKDNKDHRADGVNPCIVGDTLISVADGRNAVKIKNLVGTTYPVYTIKDGKVIIGKASKTWKTRDHAEVWKLTLDDGSSLLATPDHKIMLRNGEYKELRDLTENESLMPFNSYISNKRYRQISSNRVTCSKSCSNTYRSLQKEKMYNHKIKSIEFYGYEDVYDITVDDTHNFGIITQAFDDDAIQSTGIFIHNCSEQSLESYELCCLVETFPMRADSMEDYLRTLKFAYLYAKTVTLGQTHWPETNRVMLRNRRIGCSASGIAQFITAHGIETLRDWLEKGYDTIQTWDREYSDWLAIPRSIKTTSVKPSGCAESSLKIKTTNGIKRLYDIFLDNEIDLADKFNEYREWYDVKKDIFVYDSNNDKKKITKLFINGYEETIKFTMEDGSIMNVTPNHKFLLKNGRWKEAKDITEKDDFFIKS